MSSLYDILGMPEVADFKPAPPEQGDISRGWDVGIGQTVPIAKGLVGLAGATAENIFGEGGLSTAVKDWGYKGFKEGMEKLQPLQRETDELTTAWDRASQGDIGALVDWLQYGVGYGLAQATEAAALSIIGGMTGAALAPAAAPVAGAGGAITGLVARGAVKEGVVGLIEKAVIKEANSVVAAAAAKGVTLGAEEAVKAATKSIAREIGSTSALLAWGSTQELGSIYPEAEDEAARKGEKLTGADLARVWGAGLVAGGIEGLTDRLGIQAATGKIKFPGSQTRIGSAALTGGAGALVEGGTEAVQTAIEHYGAGVPIADEKGVRNIINAAGLGAVGGGVIGGGIGLLQGPAQRQEDAAFHKIADAKNVDEAVAAFEATHVPLDIPAGFDGEAAIGRLDAQPLYAQPMGDVSGETGTGSAEFVPDAPFNERLETLREQLGDARIRQQIRDNMGPQALGDALYYAKMADWTPSDPEHPGIPNVTRERMLQVAEAYVGRAQVQLLPQRTQIEGPDVGALPAPPEVPRLTLDTTPTGRIRVDADGVAVQEIGADVVSMADRARAMAARRGNGMTDSYPQGFPDRPGVMVGTPQQVPEPAEPQKLLPAPVDMRANEAAPSPQNGLSEPTQPQKEAGNYQKGHDTTTFPGLDISFENPQGSVRKGVDKNGQPWENTLRHHYGYIKGTVGRDKDHIDVFVKPGTPEGWSGTVFVVDQVHPDTGKFDEHKVMLGFDSTDEAKAAYQSNYAKDWKGMRSISAVPFDTFKQWAFSPELTTKPFLAPMAERAKNLTQAEPVIAEPFVKGSVGEQMVTRVEQEAPVALMRQDLTDEQRGQLRAGLDAAPAARAGELTKQQWADHVVGAAFLLDRLSKKPITPQGEPDAQAVRGDAGQVRPRSPEGQPSVQRGPVEGGGDLQREAQGQPGDRAEPGRAGAAQQAGPQEQEASAVPAAPLNTQARPLHPSRVAWAADVGDNRLDAAGDLVGYYAGQEIARLPAANVGDGTSAAERAFLDKVEKRWNFNITSKPDTSVEDARGKRVAKEDAQHRARTVLREAIKQADEAGATKTTAKLRRLLNDVGHGVGTKTAFDAAENIDRDIQRELDEQEAAPAADHLSKFDGVQVTQEVRIAETGETAKITLDAGQALRRIEERQSALEKLRSCLIGGGA